MIEVLPADIREALDMARRRDLLRRSRLRLHAGERIFPIRRLWDGGISVDADGAPHLRGLVDVYDGTRHLCECLIVASEATAGEMVYEFKRATPATDRPARDFYVEEGTPVALIGRG